MEKIKRSFYEVISGEPKKEHYVNVFVVSIAISTVIAILMMVFMQSKY